MNRRIERSEPILPSRDLAETRSFYEALGFRAWFRLYDADVPQE
jgi:hypothetical protein